MNNPSGSPWMITSSGRHFPFTDLSTDDIYIEDIAHALSNICRWMGHTKEFYSVAQHSVLVASIVPYEHMLQALLHDASEAYLGDLCRPLKRSHPIGKIYYELENSIQSIIYDKYGLPYDLHETVKVADERLCFTESQDLIAKHSSFDPQKTSGWAVDSSERIRGTIFPETPRQAKSKFLVLFNQLTQYNYE